MAHRTAEISLLRAVPEEQLRELLEHSEKRAAA
jgi:hypothetical protein